MNDIKMNEISENVIVNGKPLNSEDKADKVPFISICIIICFICSLVLVIAMLRDDIKTYKSLINDYKYLSVKCSQINDTYARKVIQQEDLIEELEKRLDENGIDYADIDPSSAVNYANLEPNDCPSPGIPERTPSREVATEEIENPF